MTDWTTCEGDSRTYRPTRRQWIGGSLAAALLANLLSRWGDSSALAQVQLAPKGSRENRDTLVTIFLRGGMDGLSLLVPYGDDDYHRARPTLGLGMPRAGGVVAIDGFFGLHPALTPLEPLFKEGKMAGIHAIGSQDQSRSHFEAMAAMERGAEADPAALPSGWLARTLSALPPQRPSPLRAVAFGSVMPDILRGATDVSVLQELDEIRLNLPANHSPGLPDALRALYTSGSDPVRDAGRETLAVLESLKRLDPTRYKPANGAVYPESTLGNGLKQTALLIKADIGMEAAALDRGGWDSHVTQGGATGWLATQFDDVARALAAFARDLGPAHLARTTCLVMTEFGRRVAENGGLGTDHGRGSAWLVLGGGVRGGKVHGKWPGLATDRLEAPGDLRVTTDYRNVLAEIVATRLQAPHVVQNLFPGLKTQFPGVVA